MKSEVTSIRRGHSTVSAQTSATSYLRRRFINSGVTKLAWRISMAWRMGRAASDFSAVLPDIHGSCLRANDDAFSVSWGSNKKKSSSTSGLKIKFGGNCHKIGPSFAPRLKIPEAKKFATGALASFRRLMWVMKRGAFTEKTNSSGVSAAQRSKLVGRCRE